MGERNTGRKKLSWFVLLQCCKELTRPYAIAGFSSCPMARILTMSKMNEEAEHENVVFVYPDIEA